MSPLHLKRSGTTFRACLRLFALVVVLALPVPAVAQEFEVPRLARVVDQAGALRPQTRAQLSRLLEAHERISSNQVVVVTLAALGGRDIAEIGLLIGRTWKLGTRHNSNGALLIIAPHERQVRIEVGYGLEGALPDARAHRIIQWEILPRFRDGDLDAGVLAGVGAIIAAIEGTYDARERSFADTVWLARIPFQSWAALGFVVIFLLGAFLSYATGGRVKVGFGGSDTSGGGGSSDDRSSTGSYAGGGGSFGGGGASGKW